MKRPGTSNGYIANTVEPSKWPISKEYYYCPELGRTSNRPGAYDAFDKPSLDAGGNRHAYRFAKEESIA